MTAVEVTTGSRLHFGLICGHQCSEWMFGGVGLMLRQPAWRLSIRALTGNEDCISADPETTSRVSEFLTQIRTTLPFVPVGVVVTEGIPFHRGFGAGTQLALALAAAMEVLSTRHCSFDPHRLAKATQRAARSAVGTVGFCHGGFLIDRGLPSEPEKQRQVNRISIPEDWRFVLVGPELAQGLCGDRERLFFSQQIRMPEKLVETLVNEIQQNLEPSIRRQQFDRFVESLETYGRTIGSFYAAEQGGVIAHPAMRELVDILRSHGISGAAQSSWGPGISIPASSSEHARRIAALVPETLNESRLNVAITEPLNTAASIRTIAPETGRTCFA